ncbi:MAG TPA: diguanylate cyclase [Dermatophilaceae bacterium]|nr:diguanylate cyclase [Dermatophilaceae bacterium]
MNAKSTGSSPPTTPAPDCATYIPTNRRDALLEELADQKQAISIGQRVLAAFHEPVPTAAGELAVSASIGIHIATDDDDYDSLLRASDSAMYDAKRSGPGGVRFSSTHPRRARPVEPT